MIISAASLSFLPVVSSTMTTTKHNIETARKSGVLIVEEHVITWTQGAKLGMNESLWMPYNVLQWEAAHKSSNEPRKTASIPITKCTPHRLKLLRKQHKKLNNQSNQLRLPWHMWWKSRPYCCVAIEDSIYQSFLRARVKHTTYKQYLHMCLKKSNLKPFLTYLNSLKNLTCFKCSSWSGYLEPDVEPKVAPDVAPNLEPDVEPKVAPNFEINSKSTCSGESPCRIATTPTSPARTLNMLCVAIEHIENANN